MQIEQLNLFFPIIIKAGEQYIQLIDSESWIQNPNNQRYYLLARNHVSASSWRAIINSVNSDINIHNLEIEYDNYQQFFDENESHSCVSPIKYEHTYLTASGTTRHNLFYALKDSEGKYHRISLTKAEVKTKIKPQDSTRYSPIVTVQVLPNREIVEIASNVTLPQRFQATNHDNEKAIANLNLALQANKSQSPDAALLLQTLMVEICLQNYTEITPGFDLILAKLVDNNVQAKSSFRISPTQIQMLHSLFIQSKGWWNWNWEKGKFKPMFELAFTVKLPFKVDKN